MASFKDMIQPLKEGKKVRKKGIDGTLSSDNDDVIDLNLLLEDDWEVVRETYELTDVDLRLGIEDGLYTAGITDRLIVDTIFRKLIMYAKGL